MQRLCPAAIRCHPAQLAVELCPVPFGKLRAPRAAGSLLGKLLHSAPTTTTTPAQQRTNSQLGTVKARSTLSPQVDTLAQRERSWGSTEGSLTWATDSRPSGPQPCYPAQLLCHAKRGDISCGRGYNRAKGRAGGEQANRLWRLEAGSAGERVPMGAGFR